MGFTTFMRVCRLNQNLPVATPPQGGLQLPANFLGKHVFLSGDAAKDTGEKIPFYREKINTDRERNKTTKEK